MATLQMFMTREELDDTLYGFASRHKLTGLLRTWEGYCPYSITEKPSQYLARHEEVIGVYLLPKNGYLTAPVSEEAFAPRQIGAVQISPGGLVKRGGVEVLLLTSFSAEDKQGLAFRPAAWLRQLKKRMQAEEGFVFGVEGVNTVYGGGHAYRNIGYSTHAAKLHQQGVLWKQYADDNSEFSPTATTSSETERVSAQPVTS